MPASLQVAALSDVGCVRTNNEDNFGYDPASAIYVVCDGMGGMAAGEVASSIACSTVVHVFAAQVAEMPVLTRLAVAIQATNDAVRKASTEAGQHGMGTTLVAAVVQGDKLLIGNVGDSRAYLFQDATCRQITVDHSYANELVRQGAVRIEDLPNVDLQGMETVITRAIGAHDAVEPDFFSVDLKSGDTVLLASDGLTRYVDGATLAHLVDPEDIAASCQRLIKAARDAGGADNITCLMLRYDSGETSPVLASDQLVEEPYPAREGDPEQSFRETSLPSNTIA